MCWPLSDDRVIEDGGMVVQDDRIRAVGKAADLGREFSDCKSVDGARHAVLPGLVNLHMHSGLIRGMAGDLSPGNLSREPRFCRPRRPKGYLSTFLDR